MYDVQYNTYTSRSSHTHIYNSLNNLKILRKSVGCLALSGRKHCSEDSLNMCSLTS